MLIDQDRVILEQYEQKAANLSHNKVVMEMREKKGEFKELAKHAFAVGKTPDELVLFLDHEEAAKALKKMKEWGEKEAITQKVVTFEPEKFIKAGHSYLDSYAKVKNMQDYAEYRLAKKEAKQVVKRLHNELITNLDRTDMPPTLSDKLLRKIFYWDEKLTHTS